MYFLDDRSLAACDSGRLGQCLGGPSFWAPDHLVASAWTEHAPFAFWLTGALAPRTFVELGTHHGFSYFAVCQAVRALGLATRCWAVDTWTGDEHAGLYGEEVFDAVAAANEQDYSSFSRLLRGRFDEALPGFADGTIDLLHIDGRHRYEDVVEDFRSWVPKLSARAVVLFHDTNVREGDFGVWRFWEEVAPTRPSFEFMHGHGLGVLAFGPQVAPALLPLLEGGPAEAAAIRAAYARLGGAIAQTARLEALKASLAAQEAARRESERRAEALAGRLEESEARAARAIEQMLEQKHGRSLLHEQEVRAKQQAASLRQDVEARDEALAGLRGALDAARAEAAARQAEVAQQAALREALLTSTSWRVTAQLRAAAPRFSEAQRRLAWRAARLAWWGVTPHRLPARLRYLRDRPQAPPPPPPPSPPVAPAPTPSSLDLAAIFDEAHYLGQFPPGERPGVAPIEHYRRDGWREGRSPHPLFDTGWYLAQNPDVREAGAEPFEHYLRHGWQEGRRPHPLFDLAWLEEAHPGLAASGRSPLEWLAERASAERDAAAGGRATTRSWPRSERRYHDIPRILPVEHTPAQRAAFSALEEAEVLAAIERVEVLSFDIFDTALFRTLGHPTTVFELLEAELAEAWGAARAAGLADARFDAERRARQRAVEAGRSQEIGLRDIHDMLAEMLGLSPADRALCEQTELAIERRVLKANPRVLRWALAARKRGRRVIFVSDMYLPGEVVTDILDSAGYPAPEVHMSCDYAAGKWETRLFDLVSTRIGVAGERICHVGDNPGSDLRCARAAGWQALLYTDGPEAQPYILQNADGTPPSIDSVAVSVALGAARVHRAGVAGDGPDRLARLIGHEVLGPTALGFAGWVATQSQARGLDRVLFLSRDGWLPYQAYRRIAAALGGPPWGEARYVWASRRMLSSVGATTRAELLERLPDFSAETTLLEYADILRLEEHDLLPHLGRHGFSGLRQAILPEGDPAGYVAARERLARFLEPLTPEILRRLREHRAVLAEYYDTTIGLSAARRIGIVDLGWSGRLVAPLESVLRELRPELELRAWFFGTGRAAELFIPPSVESNSYLFHQEDAGPPAHPTRLPDLARPAAVIGASPSLMELLISANHTTVIGLERLSDGTFTPVHAAESFTPDQRRFLALAHESCLAFVEGVLPALPRDPRRWDFREVVAKGWRRLLASPDAEEAAFLGRLPHRVDASGLAAHAGLIGAADPAMSGEALWEAWERSLWPAGWFAIQDPMVRARMLRVAGRGA